MAARMSNRDRIARMAQEKAAERREKEEATARRKEAPPAATRARSSAPAVPGGAMRLVWVVCDQAGNAVKTYPYREKAESDAEARRLTEKKGKLHFVKKDRAPLEGA